MRRLAVLPLLAFALAACPDRQEAAEELGSQPGKLMQQMKGATERARDEASSRREQLDPEERR
jgi:hypothetical protein